MESGVSSLPFGHLLPIQLCSFCCCLVVLHQGFYLGPDVKLVNIEGLQYYLLRCCNYMVQEVDAVKLPDHLNLVQFLQCCRDCHEICHLVVLEHLILEAGIDLGPDDECEKLDKDL